MSPQPGSYRRLIRNLRQAAAVSPAVEPDRRTVARNGALRSAQLLVKLVPHIGTRPDSLVRCERAARALLTDLHVLREEARKPADYAGLAAPRETGARLLNKSVRFAHQPFGPYHRVITVDRYATFHVCSCLMVSTRCRTLRPSRSSFQVTTASKRCSLACCMSRSSAGRDRLAPDHPVSTYSSITTQPRRSQ